MATDSFPGESIITGIGSGAAGAAAGPPNTAQDVGTAASNVGGAISAFSSIQNALSAFYAELTNGKMWRSLGWLLLGIALMGLGAWLWIKPSVLPVPV